MYLTLRKHPWVALLGWLPPAWLIGVVRTWGKDEYDIVVADLFDLAVTVPGAPVWPVLLYRRLRRDQARYPR